MISETGKAGIITLSFVAVVLHVPVIGAALSMFLPLPLLFYRSRLGRTGGGAILAVGVVFVLAATAGGPSRIEGLLYSGLLLLGFFQAELLEKRFPVAWVVGASALGALMAGALAFWIVQSATGGALVEDYRASLAAALDMVLAAQKDVGADLSRQMFLEENRELILTGWIRLSPALAGVWTLVAAWVNFLVARRLFAVRGMAFPAYGPLDRWKAPEHLVWAAIASVALALLESTRVVGLSGIMILGTVYFFQGIAVIEYWMKKKNAPRALRFFAYVIIVLQQILILLVAVMGFFDLWADFRRLRKTEEPQ
ncbi:MAG: YybS family protein [Proteobacteria bacterium]|nr:YybS family protein [Pseudomonadota bacterium]